MSEIHDKFSRDVYSFLEEKKKVDKLVKYTVEFPKFAGIISKMNVELHFSSVSMREKVLEEMFHMCDASLKEHTGGRLRFVLLGIDKSKTIVPASLVTPLELTTMWEQFNSSSYIPQEGFYNYFKMVMKIQKGAYDSK